MKSVLALLLAAVSLTPAFAEPANRPAPEFAIHMVDGGQKLLSSYKGKTIVLAFFFTTCPHCQDTARLLSRLQPEYAAKGVQVLAAAFDDNAQNLTADFARTYVQGFPMGYSDRGSVLEFLQKSIMTPLYVPVLVFIDRKGIIEDQYIGDPTFLKDPEKNIRAEVDKLLAKPAGKSVTKVSAKK
jgi:peroxiredoxin